MIEKKSILFIIKNRNEASSRFRVTAYLPYLKPNFAYSIFHAEYNNKKVPKVFRSLIKRLRFLYLLILAYRHDIVLMQRPMSSDKSKAVFFEKLLSKVNQNLIFDFDDALFIQNEEKIKSLISLSKICICGNDYLAEFAKKHNKNSYIIPTAIDSDKYTPANNKIQHDKITIGWTGTSGNYDFFSNELIQDIKNILLIYPNVEFLFICDKKPDKRFEFKYKFIKWDEKTESEDLQKIDIGLMPLLESPWTKGKCGFKLIQYGSIAISSIASDVGVNKEVVLDEKTGYIINENSPKWKEKLEFLINNKKIRTSMGIQARKHIEKNYSIKENYPKLKKVLLSSP